MICKGLTLSACEPAESGRRGLERNMTSTPMAERIAAPIIIFFAGFINFCRFCKFRRPATLNRLFTCGSQPLLLQLAGFRAACLVKTELFEDARHGTYDSGVCDGARSPEIQT